MCEIADPAGRYAEHRTMKGEEVYFYQGTDFIRDVEVEAQREMAAYFGCSDIELRPISGQMANEVVFKGMAKFVNRDAPPGTPFRRIRAVMNNDLNLGGVGPSPWERCSTTWKINPQTAKRTSSTSRFAKTIPIESIPSLFRSSSRSTGPSDRFR